MTKSKFPIFIPLAIITSGAAVVLILLPLLNEWVFIPLALFYWGAIFFVSYKGLGKDGIRALYQKPGGSKLWLVLSLVVGLIPLPILLMNLYLFTSPLVITLWLLFAIANPHFEQIFWRGYLLSELPFPTTWRIVYSAALFVISHPLMWGLFSIANRSWMMMVSLTVMGVVWGIVYVKTKSLWWCLISHHMVNVFNLSVFVFLNIYIPPELY